MFCKKCGSSLDSQSVYCDRCGAAVNGAVEKVPSSLPVGSIVAIALAVVYLFLLFAPWVSVSGEGAEEFCDEMERRYLANITSSIDEVMEEYQEFKPDAGGKEVTAVWRRTKQETKYLRDGKLSPYETRGLESNNFWGCVTDRYLPQLLVYGGALLIYYASVLLSFASVFLFLKGQRNWVQIAWTVAGVAELAFVFFFFLESMTRYHLDAKCRITVWAVLAIVCLAGTFFCRLRPILPGQSKRQGNRFTSY